MLGGRQVWMLDVLRKEALRRLGRVVVFSVVPKMPSLPRVIPSRVICSIMAEMLGQRKMVVMARDVKVVLTLRLLRRGVRRRIVQMAVRTTHQTKKADEGK